MGRRRRIRRLSDADRKELWRRWRQGESLYSIARALDRQRQVVELPGKAPVVKNKQRSAAKS